MLWIFLTKQKLNLSIWIMNKTNKIFKMSEEDFEKFSKEFLKLIREDYNDGFSQECEGTFKIKNGKVTEINVDGIALIPRFRKC